jgi:hypothetical protein
VLGAQHDCVLVRVQCLCQSAHGLQRRGTRGKRQTAQFEGITDLFGFGDFV